MTSFDFSPLKKFSWLFLIYIWAKRVRMIALRLIILGFIVYIFMTDVSFSSSGSSSGEPLFLLLFLWFVTTYALLFWMNRYWRMFAKRNNLSISINASFSNFHSGQEVPSFKGKKLAVSLPSISGKIGENEFSFFTRIYKEGGILRWRERKMDTILMLKFNKLRMPHIVINSTANEKARKSNLSAKFKSDWKFQFEGAQGSHYDAYTAKDNRIVALQLFTPDVLSIIYMHMPTMDIEVKNESIWFVQRYGILNDRVAREIFFAVQEFIPEFDKQLRSARLLQ